MRRQLEPMQQQSEAAFSQLVTRGAALERLATRTATRTAAQPTPVTHHPAGQVVRSLTWAQLATRNQVHAIFTGHHTSLQSGIIVGKIEELVYLRI